MIPPGGSFDGQAVLALLYIVPLEVVMKRNQTFVVFFFTLIKFNLVDIDQVLTTTNNILPLILTF